MSLTNKYLDLFMILFSRKLLAQKSNFLENLQS